MPQSSGQSAGLEEDHEPQCPEITHLELTGHRIKILRTTSMQSIIPAWNPSENSFAPVDGFVCFGLRRIVLCTTIAELEWASVLILVCRIVYCIWMHALYRTRVESLPLNLPQGLVILADCLRGIYYHEHDGGFAERVTSLRTWLSTCPWTTPRILARWACGQ